MKNRQDVKYTRYVTFGWWLSFIFLVAQTIIISLFNLCATNIAGVIAFSAFVILTFSPNYDKEYEFSPYRGLLKLFKKKKMKERNK